MKFQCYLNTAWHMPAMLTLEGAREEIFPRLLAEAHGPRRETFSFGFPYALPTLQRQKEEPVFLLDCRAADRNEHRFLHQREEDAILFYSDEKGWRRIGLQVTEYDYDLTSLVSYADSVQPEPQWVLREGERVSVEAIARRFFSIASAADL